MWNKKGSEEAKGTNLLKELCGDDARLCEFLSSTLFENPLVAISATDLDTLIGEAERSGNYRSALDKAIFEGAQKPDERDKYTGVVQMLASKTVQAAEKEREKAEKEGLTGRVASLGARIENHRFMSARAGDVLAVASRFYAEKLLEVAEDTRKEARGAERRTSEWEERKIEDREQAAREARRKGTKEMGREEKKEAERLGKSEELAAGARKEARAEEKTRAETEEKRIEDLEKAAREARRKERQGS